MDETKITAQFYRYSWRIVVMSPVDSTEVAEWFHTTLGPEQKGVWKIRTSAIVRTRSGHAKRTSIRLDDIKQFPMVVLRWSPKIITRYDPFML